MPRTSPVASQFIAERMREAAKGGMRTGVGGIPGKRGPVVTNPKQAAAIAYSEARGKGMKAPPPKKGSAGSRQRIFNLLSRAR